MSAIMENQIKLNEKRSKIHESINIFKHYIIVVCSIVISVNAIHKLHPAISIFILWAGYMKYKNNSDDFIYKTENQKKTDLLILLVFIMIIYINKTYPLYISSSLLMLLYKKFIDVDEYVFCNT